MKKWLSLICVLIFMLGIFGGCSGNNGGSNLPGGDSSSSILGGGEGGSDSTSVPEKTTPSRTDSEMFTDRDYEVGYDENAAVQVQLSGNTATADSDGVRITGSTVTITKEATYVISGTLNNGMIIVNAPETAKLQLVLNGVQINSETSAALYIVEADKVFVTLADHTENTLSNGGTFTAIDENNIDGAIFSKQDLTINGLGSLTVTSPAGHGIVCKDDLVLTSGTYHIDSAAHGIDANDSVRIANASVTIDAGKDGVHSENDDDPSLGFVYISSGVLNIEAEGDGISAEADLQIQNGSFYITAGGGSENGDKSASDFYGGFKGNGKPGSFPFSNTTAPDSSGSSMKGLKATGDISISDGTVTVNSADDAIHSNASVTINGGTFQISSGDDGIHADEALTVTSGTIQIDESYEGMEGLHIIVSGGDIRLTATDDGINAAGGMDTSGTGGRDALFGSGKGGSMTSGGSIVILDGTIDINASGDGIDSNGSLSITGGSITVSIPNMGDTSILDFDSIGTISGGTFIGIGASGMAQNFSSSSTQGTMMIMTGVQPAGAAVQLTDSDGNVLISVAAAGEFSCVILSRASIIKDGTYTLTAGSFQTTITMNDTVYTSGGMGGNGGMGGPGGMKGGKPF